MAPKKDQDNATLEKIKILCILMAADPEFAPDLDIAAQGIGLAQGKNVTRKINAIIEPVGYTMKRKKIVKVNDSNTSTAGPSTTATSSTSATTTTTATSDDDDAEATTTPSKKIKTPAKKAAAKTKTPAKSSTKSPAKKRKMEESDDDNSDEADDDNEDDDSPATKAIKEAMAGSDVEPGIDSSD